MGWSRAASRAAFARAALLLVPLLATACGSEGHPGVRQADCWTSGCHDPAATHHGGDAPYTCVPCHGRNGAPSAHGETGCGRCHGERHGGPERGFTPESCPACHPG